MLNISLGDYRIISDKMNYILNKKVELTKNTRTHKIGDVIYKPVGFYGTLEGLCKGLLEHRVKGCSVRTLQGIVKILNTSKKELATLIKETENATAD